MKSEIVRAVAVIPARGGSKRLPRKNIAALAGKPMVAWVIEAALGARHLGQGRVFVSTEDPEIAAIARTCGAGVVQRPVELCGDQVWTEPVIRHAVENIESERGPQDIVVWLNASIPEIRASDIDAAVDRLRSGRFREVFAVDSEWRATSAVRVLVRDALEQRSLSVNVSVLPLDYIDVHFSSDLEIVERRLRERRQS
ncbi:MAG: acylneuraminate cytidylyltransferase family protein [Sandaracinaceae bacterium]|nr:acylneuraminate cytidylyltransferase family protein [Sandaracinaceae bacterium]